MTTVPYASGVLVALAVAMFARVLGFERERSFYPTILMVIATYYVLFAVMGASTATVLKEVTVLSVFVLAAVAGALRQRWLVVIGLAAHGVFDLLHPHLIENEGVPLWWPGFCLAYDLTAAGYLALRFWYTPLGKLSSRPGAS